MWVQIVSIVSLALLLIAWLAIQRAWQRAFPEAAGEDALSGRLGCRGCGCGEECRRGDDRRPRDP